MNFAQQEPAISTFAKLTPCNKGNSHKSPHVCLFLQMENIYFDDICGFLKQHFKLVVAPSQICLVRVFSRFTLSFER